MIWRICAGRYARARLVGGEDIFLHRFLVDAQPGWDVDHLNRCPWDNRRENLKIVQRWENNRNKGLPTEIILPSETEKKEAMEQRLSLKTPQGKVNRGAMGPRIKSRVSNSKGEVFQSCKAAAEAYGAPGGANISQCALGNRQSAYGLKWFFLDR